MGEEVVKYKTLIIDDHPASIVLLKNMLADYCECFIATNGQKGIELFASAQNKGEPFEIVLLDIIMPGLDGLETLKRIRKIELSKQRSPGVELYEGQKGSQGKGKFARIIMQTSSEDPQDFLVAYKEGKCNGFINKPYSKDEIIRKVLGQTDYMSLVR